MKNIKISLFQFTLLCLLTSSDQQAEQAQAQPASYLASFSDFVSSTINDGINSYFQSTDQKIAPTELFTIDKRIADPTKTKTTYNPNKSKTIEQFDIQGKNITRTELDARDNTTSETYFNIDGTQIKMSFNPDRSQTIESFGTDRKSALRREIDARGNTIAITNFKTRVKTSYNQDKTQTIDTFDNSGQSTSRTDIDARGNKTNVTIFNSAGTQTKTTYNPDKTQTINTFDNSGQSTSRTEIDARGNKMSEITFNSNGTQTKITYHPDKTKTIDEFGTDRKSKSRTELDAQGNPTSSITFNNDDTQALTIYNADKTQTTDLINLQGHRLSKTHVNAAGHTTTAPNLLITAWHEAGHAVCCIRKDTLALVNHITIKADAAKKTAGHVISTQTYNIHKSVEEIENSILATVCGGTAEQILMQERMLTSPQEILKYLADPRFDHDMQLARKDAQEIVTLQTFQHVNRAQIDQKVDGIIVQLYKKAYEFLVAHKHELQKVAESLMKNETLTTDETYTLLNADVPLLAGQQGPLPASLVDQYKYRGWQIKSNYATTAA